jgi:hypothetical protein
MAGGRPQKGAAGSHVPKYRAGDSGQYGSFAANNDDLIMQNMWRQCMLSALLAGSAPGAARQALEDAW